MKSSKKDNAVSFTVIMASFKKLFLKYLWHSPAQIMLSLLGRDMEVMDKYFWLKSKQLFGKQLFVRTTTYSMHLLCIPVLQSKGQWATRSFYVQPEQALEAFKLKY